MIKVKLISNKLGVIYYTLDGTYPTSASPIYDEPIPIYTDTDLQYFCDDGFGHTSQVASAIFVFGSTGIFLVTDDGEYLMTEDGDFITIDVSTG